MHMYPIIGYTDIKTRPHDIQLQRFAYLWKAPPHKIFWLCHCQPQPKSRWAVPRCILTAHDRAKIIHTCREMTVSITKTLARHAWEWWKRCANSHAHSWEFGKSFQTREGNRASESNWQDNIWPTHCREEGQCCFRQLCGDETGVKWYRLVCSISKVKLADVPQSSLFWLK